MTVEELKLEPEAEEKDEGYFDRLKILINNQPEVLFSIFQELLDLLVAAEVMKPEDVEALIRAGMARWVEGGQRV